MSFVVPRGLIASCRLTPDRTAWLARLPDVVADLRRRWSLTLDAAFDSDDVSCAWVAPARLPAGTAAVLKLGMPHMEADHEIDGLRFWNGDPTWRLLAADDHHGAMLLERCEPGTSLRAMPEPDQDVVVANLLRRLWRTPLTPHPFRPLQMMIEDWSAEALANTNPSADIGLVRDGIDVSRDLAIPRSTDVLLATDLHARQHPSCRARALARHRSEALRRRSGLRRDATSDQLPVPVVE